MGKSLSRIRCHPACGPACFGINVDMPEYGDAERGVATDDSHEVNVPLRETTARSTGYRHAPRSCAEVPSSDSSQTMDQLAACIRMNFCKSRRAQILSGICALVVVLLLLALAKVLIEIRSMRMSEGLTGVDEPSVSLKYDCEDGLNVWEVDWSTRKMDWCCWNYGVGCMHFNCEGHETSWTDLQSKWCCEVRGMGSECVAMTLAFDCGQDLGSWKSWRPEKKQWCCDYQGLGCGEEFEDSKEKASVAKAAADAAPKAPGEAQSESGSPGSVSTTLFTKCQSECVIDEVQATCSDWVVDFAKVAYRGQHNACGQAYSLTRVKCGKACDECPIDLINCEFLNSLPPKNPDADESLEGGAVAESRAKSILAITTTTTTLEDRCTEDCVVDGTRNSCADWVMAFARQAYRGRPDICPQAYTRMRVECRTACSRCALDAIDCKAINGLPQPPTTQTDMTTTEAVTTTTPLAAKAVFIYTTTTTTDRKSVV